MNKIKEIIRKIEAEKETFGKIGLLKVLDDEVSKFRKELVNKFQREKFIEPSVSNHYANLSCVGTRSLDVSFERPKKRPSMHF